MIEENKFPDHIMETLRERRGLHEKDNSEDSAINNYTKDEAFKEVLAWQGFKGWDSQIKDWVKDIYEVILED